MSMIHGSEHTTITTRAPFAGDEVPIQAFNILPATTADGPGVGVAIITGDNQISLILTCDEAYELGMGMLAHAFTSWKKHYHG